MIWGNGKSFSYKWWNLGGEPRLMGVKVFSVSYMDHVQYRCGTRFKQSCLRDFPTSAKESDERVRMDDDDRLISRLRIA